MRRHVLVLLASCVALLALGGCQPAPEVVRVNDNFFSPGTATVSRGGTVRWTNVGSVRHTTTSNSPLSLWNASLPPGAEFDTTLVAAGTYAYHCSVHFGMSGSVKVPLAVSPTSGSTATTFTVTVASGAAPSGFQYVVQKKDPGGSFQAFRTLTAASTTFRATSPGAYQFRAQLKRSSSSATSGFSDPQTVTVG
jgi:plastocyanin